MICRHSDIYTSLIDIYAKGPKAKGPKGQFAELDQWTVEMVPYEGITTDLERIYSDSNIMRKGWELPHLNIRLMDP
jgi:hypothetical protein